ncbi:MAG: hypothetical protein QXQ33_00745 [Nitrososphaerota archaeon]
MPVEIKGQQLRIRVKSPIKNAIFRTHDVGRRGRLQRIAMFHNGKWETQAWRLNLSHYQNLNDVKKDLDLIRDISPQIKRKALALAKQWFSR